MTKEEAKSCIRTIKLLRRLAFNVHGVMDVIDAQNCDKIIAMLSQEPCEDCISRNQVKSDFADWYGYDYEENWFYRHLSNIPSVKPQPKMGHWIYTGDYLTEGMLKCSECGEEIDVSESYYDFCPVCGARMVEPQAESEVNNG